MLAQPKNIAHTKVSIDANNFSGSLVSGRKLTVALYGKGVFRLKDANFEYF